MKRLPFKVLLFALLCFGMIELSYRYYTSGVTAFNPVRFNSMNQLLLSGLIEPAEWHGIPYKLKPNLNEWHQAVKLKTNSHGFADQEYSLEKPENTFRVAVVGSSWTMATSIRHEHTYHSVLEADLNERDDGITYEFLNFGVEYYGLRELVETLRQRASVWQPDAVVVAVTTYTSWLLWEDHSIERTLPPRQNPFLQSWSLRGLDLALDTKYFPRGLPEIRPLVRKSERDLYKSQLRRTLAELGEISREMDIPVMLMWLGYTTPGIEIEELLNIEAERHGIVLIDAYRPLAGPEGGKGRLSARRFDAHPNRDGHRIIADTLLDVMEQNQILPAGTNMDKGQPSG